MEDGFDLIDFEQIDKNIKFTKKIIEYFKNDYLLIVDFLKEESCWDDNIMLLFSCDKEALFEYKASMVDNIIDVYTTVITSTIQRQSEVDEPFISVDGPYINYINENKLPIMIFFEDDFCAIQMLRYFINVLTYKYDMKIDTYNTFKYDVLEILRIYEELGEKIGINRMPVDIDASQERNYVIFFHFLYKNVKNYVNNCFRNDEERECFINYLFSIGYAYIKDLELYDDELSDEDECFINLMKNNDNLFDEFYNNQSITAYVIEMLFQCYEDYQLEYDLRKTINDADCQEIFENLDGNYNTEYEDDYVINTYELDSKLCCILDKLKEEFSVEDIYAILLNNINIYKYLLEQKLDARFSRYYKKQLIVKIIVDVFEYEVYKKNIDKDYCSIHYNNIVLLKNDDNAILNYFIDDGYSLLNLYYEYHREKITYRERARKEVCLSKNLSIICKLSNFSMINYLPIFNLKTNAYIDYLNSLLDKIREAVSKNNIELLLNENLHLLINSLCLNIYLNILSKEKYDISDKNFLEIIEDVDIEEYIFNNNLYLLELCKMFLKYNNNYLSYIKDNFLINNVKEASKIKKLTQFNKFDN